MLPTEFERFRAVLAGMAELYQRELSPTLLDAYWVALRDWDLRDFEAASAHLMATARFMPRPAEWTAVRLSQWPTAAEAWLGYDGDDPDVQWIVDHCERAVFGDIRRGLVSYDELPWRQKRWIEAYDELVEAGKARAVTSPLAIADNSKRLTGGGFKQLGDAVALSVPDKMKLL